MLRTRNGLCELSSVSVVVKHKPHQVFSVSHPALRVSIRGLEQRIEKESPPESFCGVGENRHRAQVLRVERLRAIA